LLVLWKRWIAWVHLPAALWGILIEYVGFICPLTPLEVELRERAGEPGYAGGFIEHYITPVVYPPGLTRGHQIGIATVFLVLNIAIYWRVVARRRGSARNRPQRGPGHR